MTWARFNDGTPRDPKLIGLSDAAHRLWFSSVCYCCEHLTDGEIPVSALVFCYQAGPKKLANLANELVKAGLWTAEGETFTVVNFLKYNPSRAAAEQKREARSAAGKQGGVAKGLAFATRLLRHGEYPRTRPVPSPAAAAAREHPVGWERALAAWERQSPGSINPTILDALDGWLLDGMPIEWIESACEDAGRQGGRKGVNYISTILKRYRSQNGTQNDSAEAEQQRAFQEAARKP